METNSRYDVDVDQLDFKMTERLRSYLKMLIEYGGSDLHVKSGGTVRGRINGEMIPFTKNNLSHEEGLVLAKELLRGRFKELVEDKSVDFTYKYDKDFRFRVNIFFQVDGVSAVFRTIPTKLPTFESLHLPKAIEKFCSLKRGLVLVTGPTGSGKTTTLAAMINHMNHQRKEHIVTIEDPVEYEYEDDQCIINQRAIGQDAIDFASSLRAALREDPDIILVGEMRDLETIETALHAAETGHLVLSTLHTVDAKETINRVIGMFPGEEQNRITMSLASVLQGVVSQRLVRTKDQKRRAAVEVLVKTERIRSLILEKNDAEIQDAIEEGTISYGSQTFDKALLSLYIDGVISFEQALDNSSTPNDLRIRIEQYHQEKEVEAMRKNKDDGVVEDVQTEDADIIALKSLKD